MINQSGDFACYCLFLYLVVFVVPAYKGWNVSCRFLTPLFLPLHHYYLNPLIMSFPTAFPFSFKEDALAYNVVESMEQVGGLASLSLN